MSANLTKDEIECFKKLYTKLIGRIDVITSKLADVYPALRNHGTWHFDDSEITFDEYDRYGDSITLDYDVVLMDDRQLDDYLKEKLEDKRREQEIRNEHYQKLAEKEERTLYEKLKEKYGDGGAS